MKMARVELSDVHAIVLCLFRGDGEMKKILLTVFSLLLLLCLPREVSAAEGTYTEGYFQYEIVDEGIVITGYFGSEKTVTVPADIAGYPVSEIGEEAPGREQIPARRMRLPTTRMQGSRRTVRHPDPGLHRVRKITANRDPDLSMRRKLCWRNQSLRATDRQGNGETAAGKTVLPAGRTEKTAPPAGRQAKTAHPQQRMAAGKRREVNSQAGTEVCSCSLLRLLSASPLS